MSRPSRRWLWLVPASALLMGCRDDGSLLPPGAHDLSVADGGVADNGLSDQSLPFDQNVSVDLAGADLSLADLSVVPPAGPAQLLLVAVWPSQTNDTDVLELLAVTAGTTKGIVLQQDLSAAHKVKLSTLPDLVVSAGDTILVHLHAVASVTDETSATKQSCTDPTCRGDAWDVIGTGAASASIGYSSRVLAVLGSNGSILDGAAFSKSTGSQTTNYPGEVELLADTMSQWSACATPPCTAATAQAVSVNWSGLTNSADLTGKCAVRKVLSVDTNTPADWVIEPSPTPTPMPTPTPTPEPTPSPSPMD